jgi:3'(2'), 5'-bisphosphate nucleotidase
MKNNIDIKAIIEIAQKAGDEILKIYQKDDFSADISMKEDNSPLTLADKAANEVIVKSLSNLYPEIPILSEEEKEVSFSERQHWTSFWCVDPLDGTKEFIKKNGQFTVNIALIENGFPVCGVVYAPVLDVFYVSDSLSAFKIEKGQQSSIQINNKTANRIAVQSASHATEDEAKLLKEYQVTETISIGSSLKFCLVAEGKADIYFRQGPTMEWDTAAGQAVIEAAGGKVVSLENNRFGYNKENLRNSSFIAFGF